MISNELRSQLCDQLRDALPDQTGFLVILTEPDRPDRSHFSLMGNLGITDIIRICKAVSDQADTAQKLTLPSGPRGSS